MFDFTSRYYKIEDASYVHPDGTIVTYKRRRFSPAAESLPLLAEVKLEQSERLDLFAHRTLGDPLQFWRICDANNAIDPFDLSEFEGRRLRVPVPQPGS